MRIRTNNNWRHFLYKYEVPKTILEREFDYQDKDVTDSYIKYKGMYFHLDQFLRIGEGSDFSNWDGYVNFTAFTGIFIKVSDDFEQYKIAYYWC